MYIWESYKPERFQRQAGEMRYKYHSRLRRRVRGLELHREGRQFIERMERVNIW